MRLRIGDLSGAAEVIRGRQVPADSSPNALLKIASELRYEDPDLARRLLDGISFKDMNHRLLLNALGLVNDLGLQAAASAIMPRLFGPGAKQSGIVVINSVEEAIQFAHDNAERLERADANLTEKWLNGEIPLHLVFDSRPADLAFFFHRPLTTQPHLLDDGQLAGKPFLLRSGSRRVDSETAAELLVLDATALLLGNELGMLDLLEHGWTRILLPNETPELLRAMESELELRFGQVSDEAREVRRRLDGGQFGHTPASDTFPHLVIEPDDPPEATKVSLADLLAHLVARGMDRELADNALDELSLSLSETAPVLATPLELVVTPGDLVTLQRHGLLDRLSRDVRFSVEEGMKVRWLAGFDDHLDGRTLVDKIKMLRQLVARKADAGTWQFLPVDHTDRDNLKNSGAAAHLFLSMIRAGEFERCEIWGEDRMLSLISKIGSAEIIDVTSVLDRLSDRVTQAQRSQIYKQLRGAGYGFALPTAAAIVDALIAAPITSRLLVESDELTAVRRHFAVQFANSRHLIDKASGQTPGEPELLFLSRLLGLAGRVFAELWSRPNLGEERLNAAARWTSRHLRVEQAKFLPRENRTVAAREELLFLQYLSMVSAMFNVTGKSFRQARERRAKLLKWVLGAIVEPGLEIRPKFRIRLIDYFAEALASLGKPDSDHPDVTEQILASVIQDYLNAFPDDWRLELQRHALLSGLVGLREVQSIGFGKNLTFEAEQFYVTIAESYVTGKSTGPVLGGKRNAVITMMLDAAPAPDRPVAFSVKSGNSSANFADDRLELEAGDIEQRFRALKRHPAWFDLSRSEFDAVARKIAENPAPTMRRQMLADAQAKAMTWRLLKLQEQISTTGRSDKELLLPPHPDSVRQFMRLSSPVDVTADGWLDQAFMSLQDELGPLGALARIAAIPFKLGGKVDDAIVAAVDEVGLDQALGLVGPTPMVRTALLAALINSGRTEFDISGLARTWQDYGVLHKALLRLAFTSAAQRPEWQQIPEPERSILLWAHANAVLEILESQGAAPEEAAQMMDGFLNQRVDDAYRRARSFAGHLQDPFSSTWREIAGLGIAHAIQHLAGGLNDAQRNALRDVLARSVGGGWLPHPELWIPSGNSEPPGCWLALDPALPLVEVGVAELPPPFNERSPQALALLLMQKISEEEGDPEASGYWPLIWMIGVNNIDGETRSELRSLIGTRDNLPDFNAEDGRIWGGTLRYRAQLFGKDGDLVAFHKMLLTAATQAQAKHVGVLASELSLATSVIATFHRLAEAIWEFSSLSSDVLTDCMARFAEFVVLLATSWPSSLLACLGLLDVIAAQLETEPAGPLWDAINLLRGRA